MITKKLYLIVGQSGSGKTTIASDLERLYGLKQVVSYTTRSPRSDDEVGHFFVSNDVFDSWDKIDAVFDDIVARTVYNGYRYWACASTLDESATYIVDPDGIQSLRENYVGRNIRTIYISVPDEIRLARMIDRGDDVEAAQNRISVDKLAFDGATRSADLIVCNTGSISDCVNKIYNYIQNEEGI